MGSNVSSRCGVSPDVLANSCRSCFVFLSLARFALIGSPPSGFVLLSDIDPGPRGCVREDFHETRITGLTPDVLGCHINSCSEGDDARNRAVIL